MSRDNTFVLCILLVAFFVSWLTPLNAQNSPAGILNEIGIDQKLNAQVPLNLVFRDEAGEQVALSGYFHQRPVILSLVYYECPMLCGLTLNGLLKALRALPLDAGRDFDVLTISFDPAEKPALAEAKRELYTRQYGRPGGRDGWHFLTGEAGPVTNLTSAVGFRYRYDPVTSQWAHASAILVLTPDGRISQYFYGIEYSAKDLRLALVQASQGKAGSLVDRVLLYCYQYDPATGKYGFAILTILKVLSVATLLVMMIFIVAAIRRERRTTAMKL